jgi:cytochrome c553
MKRYLVTAFAVLGLLALGGLLVAASGIIPIKASSGHWAITEGFLQFAKTRSLATQTLGVELPPLGEPHLVLKGAGHYESGCRPCHGSPELPSPRVARAMLPPPPDLALLVPRRDPEELFYVVKHGLKFTGMPAWPAPGRDDEAHALVAFLLELPKLDAQRYRALVHGPTEPGPASTPLAQLEPSGAPRAVANCARCHGTGGGGRGLGAFPKLAGQRSEYQLAALDAFAADQRHSGIMQPIAAALRAEQRRELAEYYARLSPRAEGGSDSSGSGASIERGRTIAELGIPAQRVPSCSDCHGPGPERRNPAYPALAGQYAEYLLLQLELFKANRRGGSRHAALMLRVAATLSIEQMTDVAQYYAAQAP